MSHRVRYAGQYQFVCESLSKKFAEAENNCHHFTKFIFGFTQHLERNPVASGKIFTGPVYDITHIVDRVGSGDSFMGGLIYGLTTYHIRPSESIEFAIAASALKHTIFGDFNLVSVAEVEKLMKGDGSGRVSR